MKTLQFRPLPVATIGLIGLAVVGILTMPQVAQTALHQGQTWDDGRVTVRSLCLYNLPDGGARARVDAVALLADAGVGGPDNTQFFDLAGASRTTALNALSNAQTAWLNAQP